MNSLFHVMNVGVVVIHLKGQWRNIKEDSIFTNSDTCVIVCDDVEVKHALCMAAIIKMPSFYAKF